MSNTVPWLDLFPVDNFNAVLPQNLIGFGDTRGTNQEYARIPYTHVAAHPIIKPDAEVGKSVVIIRNKVRRNFDRYAIHLRLGALDHPPKHRYRIFDTIEVVYRRM